VDHKKVERDRARWSRFTDEADFDTLCGQMSAVARAAGLYRESLGVSWGATVHVDKEMVYRINHADYALCDMRDPALPIQERVVSLALAPVGGKFSLSMKSRRKLRSLRGDLDVSEGFVDYVADSQILWFVAGDFHQIVGLPEVRAGLKRHVESRPKKLFGPGRHNPLTESIFA